MPGDEFARRDFVVVEFADRAVALRLSSADMKQIEPGFWMSDTHYAFGIEIPRLSRRPKSCPNGQSKAISPRPKLHP
jgi:hypothetical protein